MSIKSKVLIGSSVLLGSTLLIAGIGFWSSSTLSLDLAQSAVTSEALRTHVESDMMHDALRGDVTAAILSMQSGDRSGYAEVAAGTKDHIENFRQLLAQNEARALSDNIKTALAKVREPLEQYLTATEASVALAGQNPQAALNALPAFQDKFTALEGPMADVSDVISAEVDSYKQAGESHTNIANWLSSLFALLAVAIAGLAAFATLRYIVAPISQLSVSINNLMAGRLNTPINGVDRNDEIGDLAKALVAYKTALSETESLKKKQEETERRAAEERRAGMIAMANEFENAVKGVVQSVTRAAETMQSHAESLNSNADKTSRFAGTVASAAIQASSNVATVAGATEELTGSIHEIGRRINDSSRAALAAVEQANKTNDTVSTLSEAARKIGDVVQIISDIASQTNLLALNATIEAARAGEAGKGFAVVASEVKSLANQTGRATEDITSQIASIQAVAREAVNAIQGIGGTIEQISQTITAISGAVEEQNSATAEISRNSQEAAQGTRQVSNTIDSVNAAAMETGETAQFVLSAAAKLTEEARQLNLEVARFIENVRAA